MSMSGFKTLFDAQSTRLERIRALASPADIQTGIIDNVTLCNKAYFENVGPTGTTGTAMAALVDLYDVMQGRETGQSLDILGVIKASSSGVGIGGSAVADKILTAVGDVLVNGGLTVYGTSALAGVTVGGSLTVADAGDFINESGTFQIKEKNIPAITGQARDLLVLDDYSNLIVELYNGSRTATHPQDRAANFGIRLGDFIQAYISHSGGMMVGNGFELDELPLYLTRGFHALGYGGTNAELIFYSPKSGETGGSSIGGFEIESRAEWVPGTDTSTASLGAKIVHAYNSGSGSNKLSLNVGGDDTLIVEKDKATFAGGIGYGIDVTVRAHAADVGEYFCRLHPNKQGMTNRVPAGANGGVVPQLQLGSGYATKTLRLGFDSYSDWNYARLHLDTQSTPNCIPAVVLGKPLGAYDAPVDNFVVCDSPWLVAVNTNTKLLATNHADKQGLFIGRGLAGTTDHKSGILWLEDAVGYKAAIQFGTNVDGKYMYVKGSTVMILDNLDDSPTTTSGLGTTMIGAHGLPFMETGLVSTDIAGIIDEIEAAGISDAINGACVLVLSTDDQNMCLFVYSSTADGWYQFKTAAVAA